MIERNNTEAGCFYLSLRCKFFLYQKMKRTPLFSRHTQLGAKMVPFAGYEMPVSYSGIVDEHQAVRQACGVFDVSHMGEFIIEGEKAADLIQYVTTNDVTQLFPGRVQYSCMPNGEGGIVDDLLVYKMSEERYMLVVNASNMEKDLNWIRKHNDKYGCSITDISDKTALIAVQGPKATEILQKLTSEKLNDIPYYHFKTGHFAGKDNVIISATGYTGAGGFEIYCRNEDAEEIWDKIFEAGKDAGIKPAGLGSRDTLRLEMGFCLYGNDINDSTSPLEAGLGWITKLNKGEFIGRDLMQQQKQEGLKKKLVGLELEDKNIPRQHYEITDENGHTIGEITSGTQSPSLNKPIALGYVDMAYAKEGSKVKVKIRNKMADARVVKIPFYQNK
jgi:aminomethyltransferase